MDFSVFKILKNLLVLQNQRNFTKKLVYLQNNRNAFNVIFFSYKFLICFFYNFSSNMKFIFNYIIYYFFIQGFLKFNSTALYNYSKVIKSNLDSLQISNGIVINKSSLWFIYIIVPIKLVFFLQNKKYFYKKTTFYYKQYNKFIYTIKYKKFYKYLNNLNYALLIQCNQSNVSNYINILKFTNNINSTNDFILNMLYFYKKNYNKNIVASNYSLQLLRYYFNINNTFNYLTSSGFNDSKLLVKRFVFFEIFIKKFLEKVILTKIFLNFVRNDLDFLVNNQYYLLFLRRIKKLQIFNKDLNLVRELIEVLIIMLYTYDVICFKNWLIKIAEKMHFKLHKRLFYVLKILISKYFMLYFKYFGCLGFCLRVQGKIGLGGSSKTRSFWIKSGQFSLTKKNLRISYSSGHIRTYSGVLGVELILSYV